METSQLGRKQRFKGKRLNRSEKGGHRRALSPTFISSFMKEADSRQSGLPSGPRQKGKPGQCCEGIQTPHTHTHSHSDITHSYILTRCTLSLSLSHTHAHTHTHTETAGYVHSSHHKAMDSFSPGCGCEASAQPAAPWY